MAANQAKEIKQIAEEAIENINRMASLLTNGTVPSATQNVSASSSSASAISELQRRFPTFNSRSAVSTVPRFSGRRSSSRSRVHPYESTASPVGRPVRSSIVTRDVIIIEKGHEHVPSKTEKVQMERKRRVVSGFDVDRNWDAEELHKQLSSLLKGTEMEDLRFEIVKNCGGTLLTPNIPSGKKIDATLLFKSISPTGQIIIRLLDYLPHVDKEIEEMLSMSVFDFDHKESEIDNNDAIIVEAKHQPSSTSTSAEPAKEEFTTATVFPATCEGYCDIDCPFDIQSILDKAKSLNLSEPLEVLRFYSRK